MTGRRVLGLVHLALYVFLGLTMAIGVDQAVQAADDNSIGRLFISAAAFVLAAVLTNRLSLRRHL